MGAIAVTVVGGSVAAVLVGATVVMGASVVDVEVEVEVEVDVEVEVEVDVVVEGSVVVSRVGGTKPTLVAASGFDGHPDTARPEPTAAITKAPNRIA